MVVWWCVRRRFFAAFWKVAWMGWRGSSQREGYVVARCRVGKGLVSHTHPMDEERTRLDGNSRCTPQHHPYAYRTVTSQRLGDRSTRFASPQMRRVSHRSKKGNSSTTWRTVPRLLEDYQNVKRRKHLRYEGDVIAIAQGAHFCQYRAFTPLSGSVRSVGSGAAHVCWSYPYEAFYYENQIETHSFLFQHTPSPSRLAANTLITPSELAPSIVVVQVVRHNGAQSKGARRGKTRGNPLPPIPPPRSTSASMSPFIAMLSECEVYTGA